MLKYAGNEIRKAKGEFQQAIKGDTCANRHSHKNPLFTNHKEARFVAQTGRFLGAEGTLFDPVTCAAGLLGDQYLPKRKVVMSIKDFGVGDGTTSTTEAFRKAVRYVQGFGEKGGTQLNVPKGLWLTGSFNLTCNFTLFLRKGAVILGSQDMDEWPIIDPLPSYGRGRKRLGGRHISLIHVDHLTNVVITGYNGTTDGQGQMRWDLWWNRTLKNTRGHLVELMNSNNILNRTI